MPKPFSPPGPATANMRFNILAAVLFIITSGLSVMFLRERLLMNAHNTGTTVREHRVVVHGVTNGATRKLMGNQVFLF